MSTTEIYTHVASASLRQPTAATTRAPNPKPWAPVGYAQPYGHGVRTHGHGVRTHGHGVRTHGHGVRPTVTACGPTVTACGAHGMA